MTFLLIALSIANAATSTLIFSTLCASSLGSEIWEGEGEVVTGGGGLPNSEAKGLVIRGVGVGFGGVDDSEVERDGRAGLDVWGRGGSGKEVIPGTAKDGSVSDAFGLNGEGSGGSISSA